MTVRSFQITERRRDGTLAEPRSRWHETLAPGPWLVVVPHDDDLVLGLGLGVAAAAREGIAVHVAVVSDGALGYVRAPEQRELVGTRARELEQACLELGLDLAHLHRFEFPDGGLIAHQGCRGRGEPATVSQRLVGLLRSVRPSHVFVCTPTDIHPDHRVCASETEMACFWASARIWLELGEPIALPERWHYAVYCPFDGEPHLELAADEHALEQKLAALAAFKSQEVIEAMVERLRAAGPYEYLRRADTQLYQPSHYRALFAR